MKIIDGFLASLLAFSSCTGYAMDKIQVRINQHSFALDVPKSPSEYSRGLMYRKSLAQNEGMIFLFNPKNKVPPVMWMKNTYLPLDMLFVGPDYRIRCILERTQPLSLKQLTCNEAVLAVIELNGGDAHKYQLKTGMEVIIVNHSSGNPSDKRATNS